MVTEWIERPDFVFSGTHTQISPFANPLLGPSVTVLPLKKKIDRASVPEWAVVECPASTGVAVGRLIQNSTFQNNKQDNSVYVFAFANCEIHTVLAKGDKDGQLLQACWLKGYHYQSCNIFFVLP